MTTDTVTIHNNKKRDQIVFSALIILALTGVVITDISPSDAHGFWIFTLVVYACTVIFFGRKSASTQGGLGGFVAKQVIHWTNNYRRLTMRSSGRPKASRFLLSQKAAPLLGAAELSVIRTLPLSLQGPDNASLTGNLSNILLSGLFRSATEPDNKTFDRRFCTDNRRCRGHYQCKSARQRRVM